MNHAPLSRFRPLPYADLDLCPVPCFRADRRAKTIESDDYTATHLRHGHNHTAHFYGEWNGVRRRESHQNRWPPCGSSRIYRRDSSHRVYKREWKLSVQQYTGWHLRSSCRPTDGITIHPRASANPRVDLRPHARSSWHADSEHCIFWKPNGLQARAFYSAQRARRYAEGADLAVREG